MNFQVIPQILQNISKLHMAGTERQEIQKLIQSVKTSLQLSPVAVLKRKKKLQMQNPILKMQSDQI